DVRRPAGAAHGPPGLDHRPVGRADGHRHRGHGLRRPALRLLLPAGGRARVAAPSRRAAGAGPCLAVLLRAVGQQPAGLLGRHRHQEGAHRPGEGGSGPRLDHGGQLPRLHRLRLQRAALRLAGPRLRLGLLHDRRPPRHPPGHRPGHGPHRAGQGMDRPLRRGRTRQPPGLLVVLALRRPDLGRRLPVALPLGPSPM
ncbi:MAG: Cytochrome c oxidase polypeptide III, partial [uncultured Acidimicrobiales bacterium]